MARSSAADYTKLSVDTDTFDTHLHNTQRTHTLYATKIRAYLVGVRQLERSLKLRVPIVKEAQSTLPLPRLCIDATVSSALLCYVFAVVFVCAHVWLVDQMRGVILSASVSASSLGSDMADRHIASWPSWWRALRSQLRSAPDHLRPRRRAACRRARVRGPRPREGRRRWRRR